jgi:POT family proton-dependent oligopeptide transporter
MMGVWFIAAALGNLFAGLVAARLETQSMVEVFTSVTMFVGIAGLVALLLSPGIKRLITKVT